MVAPFAYFYALVFKKAAQQVASTGQLSLAGVNGIIRTLQGMKTVSGKDMHKLRQIAEDAQRKGREQLGPGQTLAAMKVIEKVVGSKIRRSTEGHADRRE